MGEDVRLRVVSGGGESSRKHGGEGPSRLGEGYDGFLQNLEGMRLRGLRPDEGVACQTCADSRWVEDAGRGPRLVPCPECNSPDPLERLARLCAAAGVPARYRPRRNRHGVWLRMGLEEYGDEYPEAYRAEAAYDAALAWAKGWTAGGSAGTPERWLFIRGSGRPATALACGVAHDLLEAGVFAEDELLAVKGVLYESAVDLLDELRTSYAERTTPLEARERVEAPSLLVLDGLPASAEEKAATRLAEALRHRDGEMLPTIVVSRHEPRDLAAGLGEEVSEILADACDVLDLRGGDRR